MINHILRTFILTLWMGSAVWGPAWGAERLKMATTTSTENSGLLDVLLPPFEARWGIRVDVLSVGTGKALETARRGDVDLVLVHAPAMEEAFVREGFGVNRRRVMHNRFLLVGPPSNPAGIPQDATVVEALRRIAATRSPFLSRGDRSGTHTKEQGLWKEAGIHPRGEWYKEVGQGMGAVLNMASELQAYTLTDSGTFASLAPKLALKDMGVQGPQLDNPYSVIAVNPARHPHVRYVEAMTFIGFLTSPEGQRIIRDFQPTGTPLFWPDAVPSP